MSATAAQRFLQDAAAKSADLVHREIIRRGMDSYDAAHLKGRARIKDWEAARQKCQEIKREAINHLDRYLLQFEEKVIARGGHVFWASQWRRSLRVCEESGHAAWGAHRGEIEIDGDGRNSPQPGTGEGWNQSLGNRFRRIHRAVAR